jgi:drug/metabolite transporter (DMT)-like permease
LKTSRTFWFIIAALCVAVAAFVFAGRTMFIENLGDPMYRTLIITAYVLLGGAAGSLTKAFSLGQDDS